MKRILARTFALGGVLAAAGFVAGCSSNPLPSLTTGSLFGSKPDAAAAAAAPAGTAAPGVAAAAPVANGPKNDPTSRTLQVSRIAARAQRCGFNFDPVRLKGNFMAAEGAQPGADATQLGKLDQTYDSAFRGTLKATTKDEDYCTDARNGHIKAELARHLAGDYTPGTAFKDPAAANEGGVFDNLFGNKDGKEYKSPTLPTNNL